MAIAAVVVLPLGLLFLLSGLIVNLLQAISFVLVRPLFKNAYRRINKVIIELLWLELIWLFDWWANVKRAGCLGSALAMIKKSSLFLPVIGWSMWFSGYIFLERRWAKDENTLKSGFEALNDFPVPFWLALFVEGTRFTHAKLLAAQEYAASAGLPVPKNVLIPRTKVHVHIERHLMQDLPETSNGISQWCKDMFVAKDALLERHLATDTFGDHRRRSIGRPKKSLLVVLSWSCLLILAIVKFFERFPFSWGELAFCGVFLALVSIFMQILIVFSQSEHSTSPKVSPTAEQLKQPLIQEHHCNVSTS